MTLQYSQHVLIQFLRYESVLKENQPIAPRDGTSPPPPPPPPPPPTALWFTPVSMEPHPLWKSFLKILNKRPHESVLARLQW